MRYFLIEGDDDESNVLVSDIPEGLVRQYQLLKGISRAKDWPADVTAKFSDVRPEGMRLTDFIRSVFTWFLVSDRFKKVLEEIGVANVEYLPIRMKNHKKLVDAQYWIANFVVLVEVVDRSKSVFRVDAADDTKISRFESLVLRADVESKGPAALRMKEQPQLMMVREDLAARIKKGGFTGLTLTDSTEYKTYPVIDLGEFYADFPDILAHKVDEIAHTPADSLAPLCEEACVYFRSAGIAALLVAFDHDGFNHMLTRSALTRLYLLERTEPSDRETSRLCKISRADGFFDALAADRSDLANGIIAASPRDRNVDFEYEDDYAYVRFLYGLLLETSREAQQKILDDWKAFGGPLMPKLDVCAALVARDAAAFDDAFSGLVGWRSKEIEAEFRSLARDEMAFAGNRHVYVEGLAILRLAGMLGIATKPEYRYCPREARLPISAPFPEDLYPMLAE